MSRFLGPAPGVGLFVGLAAFALLVVPASAQAPQAPAPAQSPAPTAGPGPSSGTATAPPAVDLSSSAAGGVLPPGAVPPPPKPARPSNPIRVKIHKEAQDWDPVPVKTGGDLAAMRSEFEWRLKKAGKGYAGKKSKAKAVARLYKAGDDARLVISVFPDKLAEQRTHLEVRYLVVEGWLEKVEVAAVTADAGGSPLDDAKMLEAEGVGFQEENPAGAFLRLAAVDVKTSKSALNAGSLMLATFPESVLNPKSLGMVSLKYVVKGVEDKRPRAR